MVGAGFGESGTSGAGRVGLSSCETTLWLASTSVVCMGVGGTRISQILLVTAGGAVGSVSEAMSYDVMCQTTQGHANMGTSGGGQVRLTACEDSKMVGVLRGESFVMRVGLSSSESTIWMSTSSVAGKAARGHSRSATVGLTVGNRMGSVTSSMSHDRVAVSGLRAKANMARGEEVMVTGGGMGSGMDKSATLRVAGTASEATVWQSDSTVRGMAGQDRRMLGSAQVVVTSGEATGSLTSAMSFDRMVVGGAERVNTAGHWSATAVVLARIGYGGTEWSAMTRGGATGCESSSWQSSSVMTCKASPSAPGTLRVALTVGTTSSTVSEALSYDQDKLGGSVFVNQSTNAGVFASARTVMVSGTMRAAGYTWATRTGHTGASATSWATDTQLVCVLAAGGAGGSRALVVTGGRRVGSLTKAISYDGSTMRGTTRTNTPSTGSSSLTVSGLGFGNKQASLSARLSSSVAGETLWCSLTSIPVAFASGSGKAPVLTVSIVQQSSSASELVSYDSPGLFRFPGNGPTSGGVVIPLVGHSFGVSDYSPGVRVGRDGRRINSVMNYTSTGSFKCRYSEWHSDTSLLCNIGQGSGSGLDIMATVGLQSGSYTHVFSYDAPELSKITPATTPTSGDMKIYLEGVNFGYTEGFLRVWIGGKLCTNAQFVTYSLITCTSPHGVGDRLPVVVQVEDQPVTVLQMFTYYPPVIASISALPSTRPNPFNLTSPTSGGG
ncbi:MAG: IPT/TIG domain-containing protein, partial [Promethearchaeia archaeon]